MNIELYPKKVLAILLSVILFLLFLNILGLVANFYFHYADAYGVIALFDFNGEGNIPAFYSSLALLVTSLLLWAIAITNRNSKTLFLSWAGLASIFLFLSIDEFAAIHEWLNPVVRESFAVSGLFYYAWVIPYGVAFVAIAIAYSRLLRNLPGRIKILFLISGAIFVAGVLGFEMLGVVLFIYALSIYIIDQHDYLSVTLTGKASRIDRGNSLRRQALHTPRPGSPHR